MKVYGSSANSTNNMFQKAVVKEVAKAYVNKALNNGVVQEERPIVVQLGDKDAKTKVEIDEFDIFEEYKHD